jgi:hypothetical protein
LTIFISLPDFITYCEYLENNVRPLSKFEYRLDAIELDVFKIMKKHKILPNKILYIIKQYIYIDKIMYNTFILKIDRISYEELYAEIIEFIIFMDDSIIYYQDNKHNLYYKLETDQLIQKLKDQIYLNHLIAKLKKIT